MAWGLYPPHSPGQEILLGELALLVVAGQQEVELDLEGVLFPDPGRSVR